MVRLKRCSVINLTGFWKKFQFHYGAIKTRDCVKSTDNGTRFNSTMVRLKLGLQVPIYLIRDGFQFHYGAIKTPNGAGIGARLEEFQFHYGAIKTMI